MNQLFIAEVTDQLATLPDAFLPRVLEFVQALRGQMLQGVAGTKLVKFAGTLRVEDADRMLQVIEEDCRKIDRHEW